MALDVGARRVGVALCDSQETVVSALEPLAFGGPVALAGAVAALVERWQAEGVVVGMPRTRAGESRGERRVQAVVEALVERLAVPLETIDERGTTAAAESRLAEAGVPPARWRRLVDGVAASIILESFLSASRSGD